MSCCAVGSLSESHQEDGDVTREGGKATAPDKKGATFCLLCSSKIFLPIFSPSSLFFFVVVDVALIRFV